MNKNQNGDSMNKVKLIIISIFLITTIILTTTCGNPEIYDAYDYGACNIDCLPSKRTGVLCKDGTTSATTNGDICSSHGGVDCWYCED